LANCPHQPPPHHPPIRVPCFRLRSPSLWSCLLFHSSFLRYFFLLEPLPGHSFTQESADFSTNVSQLTFPRYTPLTPPRSSVASFRPRAPTLSRSVPLSEISSYPHPIAPHHPPSPPPPPVTFRYFASLLFFASVSWSAFLCSSALCLYKHSPPPTARSPPLLPPIGQLAHTPLSGPFSSECSPRLQDRLPACA